MSLNKKIEINTKKTQNNVGMGHSSKVMNETAHHWVEKKALILPKNINRHEIFGRPRLIQHNTKMKGNGGNEIKMLT